MCNETGKVDGGSNARMHLAEAMAEQSGYGAAQSADKIRGVGVTISDETRKQNAARLEAARQNRDYLVSQRDEMEQNIRQLNRAISFVDMEITALQQIRRF